MLAQPAILSTTSSPQECPKPWVLLLAKREALKANKTVRLTAHSKAVTELLDLYNMGSYFGDPMVIPAKEHAAVKQVKNK